MPRSSQVGSKHFDRWFLTLLTKLLIGEATISSSGYGTSNACSAFQS
jgi:hypothetical protein